VASAKKKGLGKGLGALIGPKPEAAQDPPTSSQEHPAHAQTLDDTDRILYLDPTAIEPNPKQPRTVFDEDALEDLAASIKKDGVQEPVIVRKRGDVYELVSGERRVRASIMADLERVPAICRDVSDRDMLKLGLIENIQREDLNAIELAEGYQHLIDEFHWTQEQLAQEVGKKRATVTNTLRLLNLPGDVQHHLASGAITMGHARALLALDSPQKQSAAARKVIEQGLSVRQTEHMVAVASQPQKEKKRVEKDPNILQVEDSLRRSLGTRVAIRPGKDNRGKIEIEYYNLDDFERILEILQGS